MENTSENILNVAGDYPVSERAPNSVFIQNGDTFIGKYLIDLFQKKIFIEKIPRQIISDRSSTEQDLLEKSDVSEESDGEDGDKVPDEVFEDFVAIKNIKSETDVDFWTYQMLGEFPMDLLSNEEYEQVLNLKTEQERKKYLYAILRKFKRKEYHKLTVENLESGEEGDQSQAPVRVVEKHYKIYVSLRSYSNLTDPRLMYLSKVQTISIDNVKEIEKCGVIVLNTFTSNEEKDIAQALHLVQTLISNFKSTPSQEIKTKLNIIVISNLMTWTRTKLLGPDSVLNENKLKRRKPHVDYENLFDLENFCLNAQNELKQNKKFKLHVIGTGIPYGFEEDLLDHWFALGFKSDNALPIIEKGNNIVPLIQITDLMKIVELIVDQPRKVKKTYCLAVENERNTLQSIVQAISKRFTTHGRVENIPLEIFSEPYPLDLCFDQSKKKTVLDLLSSNLPMESVFIENYEESVYPNGANSFSDNVNLICNQFLKIYKLKPFKILIYGPRFSGKTELANKLAKYYSLEILDPKSVLQKQKTDLENQIQYCEKRIIDLSYDYKLEALKKTEEASDDDNNIDVDLNEKEIEQLTAEIKSYSEQLNNILQTDLDNKSERQVLTTQIFSNILRSRFIKLHGYIMDGWPDSFETCKQLFQKIDTDIEDDLNADQNEEEETEEEVSEEEYDKVLLPDLVIHLEGSLDWTLERFVLYRNENADLFTSKRNTLSKDKFDENFEMSSASSGNLLSGYWENLENEEDKDVKQFIRDYETFSIKNEYPTGFSQFFNDLSNFPLVYNMKQVSTDIIFENIILKLGKPNTLLGEDLAKKSQEEKVKLKQEMENFLRKAMEADSRKKVLDNLREQWAGMDNVLQYERNVAQEIRSMHLRQYLAQYVMPLVARALSDLSKSNSEFPLHYLIEYFFKENPEFQSEVAHYNEKAEEFFNLLQQFKNMFE